VGGTSGGSGTGGAISDIASTMTTVLNSTFTANTAIGTDGADAITTFGAAGGGAINVFVGGTLTLLDSTLTRNQAMGGVLAPGAVPFQNAEIGTSVDGGGIFAFFATLTVADSTLTGNQAIGGAGSAGGEGVVGSGGAISAFTGSIVTITNTTLS